MFHTCSILITARVLFFQFVKQANLSFWGKSGGFLRCLLPDWARAYVGTVCRASHSAKGLELVPGFWSTKGGAFRPIVKWFF
jgi:hypothetical protein